MRALAVCLCALMLLPLFAACKNDGTGDGTSDAVTTAPEAVSFPALWEGSTVNYRTVRPDEGTAAEQEAAMEISSALRKYSGGNPEIGTDFVMPGEEHSSESFEILVGQTSYPESRQVAAETGYGGYAVRTVGHKIVVFGWNDTSLATAVRRFTDLLEGGAEFAQPIAITGSVSETLDAIPTFEGANKVIIYSVGDKAYENVIEKSSAEAFASYCARLAEAGFEMTFDRTENSNNFAQYKKGDVGVTVYFTAFNNTVRIISEPASNMSDRSADTATVEKKCDARLTMIGRTFSKTGSYLYVLVEVADTTLAGKAIWPSSGNLWKDDSIMFSISPNYNRTATTACTAPAIYYILGVYGQSANFKNAPMGTFHTQVTADEQNVDECRAVKILTDAQGKATGYVMECRINLSLIYADIKMEAGTCVGFDLYTNDANNSKETEAQKSNRVYGLTWNDSTVKSNHDDSKKGTILFVNAEVAPGTTEGPSGTTEGPTDTGKPTPTPAPGTGDNSRAVIVAAAAVALASVTCAVVVIRRKTTV